MANDLLGGVAELGRLAAGDQVVEAVGGGEADDVVLGVAGVDVGHFGRGALPERPRPGQRILVARAFREPLVLPGVLQDVRQVEDTPVGVVVVAEQHLSGHVGPDAAVGVEGELALALVQVEAHGHSDLTEVGAALGHHGGLAGGHQGGHQDADQHGDDADHDQQLDERESVGQTAGNGSRRRGCVG